MQSSKKSAKSKGVVIFATNTATTDYVSIAEQNARLIKHYLDLPTTIISAEQPVTNRRLSTDTNAFVEWKNLGRHQAYQASPYDETLLLDADYLQFDDSLLKLFKTNADYTLFNKNRYVNKTNTEWLMGTHSLPYIWATAVFFRKSAQSELFFNLVGRIQRNYGYYKLLYNIQEGNYRNDYSFAIAHYMLNGYNLAFETFAPWPITTFAGPIASAGFKDQWLVVKDAERAYVLPKQNLHILSKEFLTSNNLVQLVDQAINE
jgi:hypothetical protein